MANTYRLSLTVLISDEDVPDISNLCDSVRISTDILKMSVESNSVGYSALFETMQAVCEVIAECDPRTVSIVMQRV